MPTYNFLDKILYSCCCCWDTQNEIKNIVNNTFLISYEFKLSKTGKNTLQFRLSVDL